ncbi:metal-dependent hydrolase [Halobaculum lipolyticum]|uniref:Metal-dependent hydrolase n=1 Tax=Halobaculum lipolyticum TaxID=3032001 RepID=A0ABD5W6L6_9EURY|nr:metal-dependent hydrolase [Halobaculum sp. DT31]
MLPWTHAAFGYLLLLAVVLLLGRRFSRAELLAVLVGTQLADVIDKPLAWWFDVVPSGRSLGHSLLFVVPLCAVVVAITWYRRHPEVGVAFGVGYLTHLVGDTYAAIYAWRTEEFTFLLWPILPPYPYDDFVGFADFFDGFEVTTPGLVVFTAAAVVGVAFLVQFIRAPWLDTARS